MSNYINLKRKELSSAQAKLLTLNPESKAFKDTQELIGYLMHDVNEMRRQQKNEPVSN